MTSCDVSLPASCGGVAAQGLAVRTPGQPRTHTTKPNAARAAETGSQVMDKPHPNAVLWYDRPHVYMPATQVFMDPPTISGSSVGLPAKVLHIDPDTGRIYRTV